MKLSILPSITHFSTSGESTCNVEAMVAYGRSWPIFLNPSEDNVKSRIFRSSCVLSRSVDI